MHARALDHTRLMHHITQQHCLVHGARLMHALRRVINVRFSAAHWARGRARARVCERAKIDDGNP